MKLPIDYRFNNKNKHHNPNKILCVKKWFLYIICTIYIKCHIIHIIQYYIWNYVWELIEFIMYSSRFLLLPNLDQEKIVWYNKNVYLCIDMDMNYVKLGHNDDRHDRLVHNDVKYHTACVHFCITVRTGCELVAFNTLYLRIELIHWIKKIVTHFEEKNWFTAKLYKISINFFNNLNTPYICSYIYQHIFKDTTC